MAGLTVSYELKDSGVIKGFNGLLLLFRNTRPMMAAIGTGLVASTHMRFVTQTSPDGQAWAPLNPLYAAGKRNARILTESGRLRNSINDQAGNDWVRIGTNVVYAAAHHFGATIKPRAADHLYFRMGGALFIMDEVTLPPRPFLGISRDDEDMIGDTIEDFVIRFTKAH